MTPLRLLLPLAALLTIGSAQRDPDAPLPGMWETTYTLVGIEGPGANPRRVEAVKQYFSTPQVERGCRDQAPPRLGEVRGSGNCTVTALRDSGPKVDREMTCRPSGVQGSSRVTSLGTQAPTRYDYQVATSHLDEAGELIYTLTVREQGVRVGDCPPS